MKKVSYISTRSKIEVDFETAMLSGLACDGGLFVPTNFPKFSGNVYRRLKNASYVEIAHKCFSAFMGDFLKDAELRSLIETAYKDFDDKAIVPLRQLESNKWLLELWHGPSLSFKDLAMQVLALLLDKSLARHNKRANILCATSGDTGAAAVAAFANAKNINLFVLYPDGGISPVQRKQMTSFAKSPHIHALALNGNFDDCQSIVKQLFRDREFCDEVGLIAVNSINWARIMVQTVYYFASCLALNANHAQKLNFIVPTGNFGDIYAGLVAKKMGAPIAKLVIANNENAVLTQTLKTGHYSPQKTIATLSPAMDIQSPSNFERLIFETYGRNPNTVAKIFNQLKQEGEIVFPKDVINKIRKHFLAASIKDDEVLKTIKDYYENSNLVIDPHTAIGLATLEQFEKKLKGNKVVLSTAHAAKFPQTIEKALGKIPSSLPQLAFSKDEKINNIKNNANEVVNYIRDKIR